MSLIKRKATEDLHSDRPMKRGKFEEAPATETFDVTDQLFHLPLTHIAEMLCPFDCFLLSLTCKTLRSLATPTIKKGISNECHRSKMDLIPMAGDKIPSERVNLTSFVWQGRRMNVFHVRSIRGVWTFCLWECQNALTVKTPRTKKKSSEYEDAYYTVTNDRLYLALRNPVASIWSVSLVELEQTKDYQYSMRTYYWNVDNKEYVDITTDTESGYGADAKDGLIVIRGYDLAYAFDTQTRSPLPTKTNNLAIAT